MTKSKIISIIIVIALVISAVFSYTAIVNQYENYLEKLEYEKELAAEAERKKEIENEKKIYARYYSESVTRFSLEFDIPEYIIYGIIKAESDFVRDTRSSAGAIGLMQIMSTTLEWFNMRTGSDYTVEQLVEADINMECGCYLLSFLHEDFGDWELAYAAYNAGRGRVQGWLNDETISQNGKIINYPIEETETYVKRVMSYAGKYYQLYYSETSEDGE